MTAAWPYLTTTKKSHSSRPEGKVGTATELLGGSLQSLMARSPLGPLSEVFPFSVTFPCVFLLPSLH